MNKKNKGQMTYSVKSISLIAFMILFTLIIVKTQYFKTDVIQEKQDNLLFLKAQAVLNRIVSDPECLAFVSTTGDIQEGVLDAEKINNFTIKYRNKEPECALEESFDYKINIHQNELKYRLFPYHITSNYLCVVLDTTGSMLFPINDSVIDANGNYNSENERRVASENGYRKLIDRVENYSLNLSAQYGLDIKIPVKFVIFNEIGKDYGHPSTDYDYLRYIINSSFRNNYEGETFFSKGLEKCLQLDPVYNISSVIFMTDGCNNPTDNTALYLTIAKNKNISINFVSFGSNLTKDFNIFLDGREYTLYPSTNEYSYRYGSTRGNFGQPSPFKICEQEGKQIASETNGTYIHAESERELIDAYMEILEKLEDQIFLQVNETMNSVPPILIPETNWTFGITQFSPEKNRDNELSIVYPITIQNNSYTLTGKIKIDIISGELESLKGYIESFCMILDKTDIKNLRKEFNLKGKIFYNEANNEICMEGKTKICKKITCDKRIKFDKDILKDNIIVSLEYDRTGNKIVVS